MASEYLSALEQELQEITRSRDARYAELFNMFTYHLGWTDVQGKPSLSDPGKRLRPLLCLWTCEAVGGEWRAALPAAAAIELIHNFSLLHDDIEDDSNERRGRRAVWKVWGLAHGVNAGDGMFALAHIALDRLDGRIRAEPALEIRRGFDTAIFKITQGQFLDICYERADQVKLEHYFEMVRGKTAALIRAACEIGARVGTPNAEQIRAFAEFGENLGVAFQIADDALGVWGDASKTGKSTRTDLLGRKKSYPVLAAMQREKGSVLRALYAQPNWSEQDIRRVEEILSDVRVRGQVMREAELYARRAIDAVASTGLENEATTRLMELADQMVDREK